MSKRADPLKLTIQERTNLEKNLKKRKLSKWHKIRFQIILLAADGISNHQIAKKVGVRRPTVIKWRHEFEKFRIDGLLNAPPPGRKPQPHSHEKQRLKGSIGKQFNDIEMEMKKEPYRADEILASFSVRKLAKKNCCSISMLYRVVGKDGLNNYKKSLVKLAKVYKKIMEDSPDDIE
jgi:transposase